MVCFNEVRKDKQGRPLANDYRLKLPPAAPKSKKQEHDDAQMQRATVSDSKMPQCSAVRHCSVRQSDTVVSGSRTPTEETILLNTSPIPNIRDSGSGLDFDKALKSLGRRNGTTTTTKRSRNAGRARTSLKCLPACKACLHIVSPPRHLSKSTLAARP